MQVHRRRKDESRAFCSPILHVVNRKRKCACKSLIAVCESLDCLIQESERKAKALTSMQFDCQMTNSKIPLDFHPAICENKNGRQWKRGDVANYYGYKRFKSTICDICRFVAVHPCQMDVHHRNGDHYDDRRCNLQTLCANCHRLVTSHPELVPDKGMCDLLRLAEEGKKRKAANRQGFIYTEDEVVRARRAKFLHAVGATGLPRSPLTPTSPNNPDS